MFSRRPQTAVTVVLGATLGGFFLWRAIRTWKRRLPSVQKEAEVELPCEVEKEVDVEAVCQTTQLPPSPAQIPPPEQLLTVPPVLVSSEGEWQELWPSLEKDLEVYPVLGLDCEWVSVNGKASAVSLLQMATYSGLCILVRFQHFPSGKATFPKTLMEVLCNGCILKVGVGCPEDGRRLAQDYGLVVSCTVDLRYLALRQRQVELNNGLSLKSMAAELLSVSLDKSPELCCSNWEADNLTSEQITYAARDAQVSIALFFHILGLHADGVPPGQSEGTYEALASRCQGVMNARFRFRDGRERGTNGETKPRCRKPHPLEFLVSGDQIVPDPRRNKRKPLGAGLSARKSPLYDNCFLYAPDGQPLCTCDKKKAKWYLSKGIGELESEEPFVVRLLFEPSGRPDSQQDYYLNAKENLCVVCGKTDSYIRKNIVPHEYRRHFPIEMKDHNSHDVLLLCTSCHAASNMYDCYLKHQLAEEYNAPQGGCEEGVRLLEDSVRRRVRSAARALLTAGEGLPNNRRGELQTIIKNYLNEQEVTEEALQKAASLETKILNQAYEPHGLKVVRGHAVKGLKGLMELERRWREHFLATMQPHYLPQLWAVDHNHSKLLRKYGKDLVIQLN